MADEKPGRKRSMKPKPGIIELEATEVAAASEEAAPHVARDDGPAPEGIAEPAETESAAADTPASDTPASDAAPDSAPQPPFSDPATRVPVGSLVAAAFGGAALALAAGVVAVSSGLLQVSPPPASDDNALATRIAGLETEVQKVLDAAPAAVPDDSALRADIEGLKAEIASLRAAPVAPPATDPEIQTRLAEIGGRLDQLTKSAEDNSAASDLERLTARVEELAAQAQAPREAGPEVKEAVAGAKSAAALAAVATLESAIARGAPYAGALSSVRQHLPEAPLGALEADAERGLPAPGLLGERLLAKLDRAGTPPSTAATFVDRLKEGAFGLVRVRPVDGAVPEISADDPWSARKAVAVRLAQGDYAGALTDWEKLDSVAQEATKGEADALKARLGADAALDGLRAAALSQTGTLN